MAVVNVVPTGADPCAALFGSAKTECEKLKNGLTGGGSSGGGTSLWSLLTNPVQFVGGIRHVFVRIAETMIGGVLIIIGLNALVKAQTNVNVVGSTTKIAKKVARV